MNKLMARFLDHLDSGDEVLFHDEQVVSVEGRDGENRNAGLGEGAREIGEHSDFGKRHFAHDLDAAPPRFLLNVGRGHELGANDRQLAVGPGDEAIFAPGEDVRQLGKLGEFADRELLFQHMEPEFVPLTSHTPNVAYLETLRNIAPHTLARTSRPSAPGRAAALCLASRAFCLYFAPRHSEPSRPAPGIL